MHHGFVDTGLIDPSLGFDVLLFSIFLDLRRRQSGSVPAGAHHQHWNVYGFKKSPRTAETREKTPPSDHSRLRLKGGAQPPFQPSDCTQRRQKSNDSDMASPPQQASEKSLQTFCSLEKDLSNNIQSVCSHLFSTVFSHHTFPLRCSTEATWKQTLCCNRLFLSCDKWPLGMRQPMPPSGRDKINTQMASHVQGVTTTDWPLPHCSNQSSRQQGTPKFAPPISTCRRRHSHIVLAKTMDEERQSLSRHDSPYAVPILDFFGQPVSPHVS